MLVLEPEYKSSVNPKWRSCISPTGRWHYAISSYCEHFLHSFSFNIYGNILRKKLSSPISESFQAASSNNRICRTDFPLSWNKMFLSQSCFVHEYALYRSNAGAQPIYLFLLSQVMYIEGARILTRQRKTTMLPVATKRASVILWPKFHNFFGEGAKPLCVKQAKCTLQIAHH